jgi:NhaA family Na+:H+ antiporter
MALTPYLVGGAVMWFLMVKSGVHATIAGVLLAFAIPFGPRPKAGLRVDEASAEVKEEPAKRAGDTQQKALLPVTPQESPSHRLEHILHKPVANLILPLFALANTGVVFDPQWQQSLASANSLGIIAGLVLGKPVGIVLLSYLAVASGLCLLPVGVTWRHVIGLGMLAGIGFTMSIFITNLAFAGQPDIVNASKMAILIASASAGVLGMLWLTLMTPKNTPVR